MNPTRVTAPAIALAVAALLVLGGASVSRAADPPKAAPGTAAAAAPAKAEAKPAAAKTMTMKGEIVDLGCYLTRGAKGAQHQSCAMTCLKNGQPMGLLSADGTVYLLLVSHDDGKPFGQAKELAAAQVEVTGPMAEMAGIKAITVTSVKKL